MHKHHWEEMPEPRAFSCRGPGWKTKLCHLFLFWSQLCIAFCKDHGWTAQLKSKPDLPRLCNKTALSRMRKNVAINFFKLQRELNRDLSPWTSTRWYGREPSVQVFGWIDFLMRFTFSSCIIYNGDWDADPLHLWAPDIYRRWFLSNRPNWKAASQHMRKQTSGMLGICWLWLPGRTVAFSNTGS